MRCHLDVICALLLPMLLAVAVSCGSGDESLLDDAWNEVGDAVSADLSNDAIPDDVVSDFADEDFVIGPDLGFDEIDGPDEDLLVSDVLEDVIPPEDLLAEILEDADQSEVSEASKGPLVDPNAEKWIPEAKVALSDYAVSPRWRLVWQDEFDGQDRTGPDDPCYTRPVSCTDGLNLYVSDCNPEELGEGMEDFNRCRWTILSGYNYWGNKTSAFHSSLVSMQNGELVLDGATAPGPFDCGAVDPANQWDWTRACPFHVGAIWGRRYVDIWGDGQVDVPGYQQKFGRFEVRTRISSGAGAFPATWLLPQDGGWPDGGEIDVMESTAPHPEELYQTLHAREGDIHTSAGGVFTTKPPFADTWTRDYHVYSAEWDATEIRYFTDNRLVRRIGNAEVLDDRWDDDTCTMAIPSGHPFYWILNDNLHSREGEPDGVPSYDDFRHKEMRIDYVRNYVKCLPEDLCPNGGAYDGASSNCILANGKMYPSPCVESTLSPACKNPCAGVGYFDGYNCFLRKAPDGRKLLIDEGRFRYRRHVPCTSGPSSCMSGDAWLGYCKGCDAGPIPAGRSPFIHGSAFYVESRCSTTAVQPPCATPCPYGGTFDGANCQLAAAPPGTTPFIWEGNFYYSKVAGANPCPFAVGSYDVWFDGANCFVDIPVSAGATPFLWDRYYYFENNCGRVFDWQRIDPAAVGSTIDSNGCSPL